MWQTDRQTDGRTDRRKCNLNSGAFTVWRSLKYKVRFAKYNIVLLQRFNVRWLVDLHSRAPRRRRLSLQFSVMRQLRRITSAVKVISGAWTTDVWSYGVQSAVWHFTNFKLVCAVHAQNSTAVDCPDCHSSWWMHSHCLLLHDVDTVALWMRCNGLQVFTASQNRGLLLHRFGRDFITLANFVRLLDIYLDISMETYFSKTVSSYFASLRQIQRMGALKMQDLETQDQKMQDQRHIKCRTETACRTEKCGTVKTVKCKISHLKYITGVKGRMQQQ